jgi:threonyl-tRNA synthetase
MRILLLHVDKFSFEVTGETSITKQLDPIPADRMAGTVDDALVCMMAVEKGDAERAAGIVKKTVAEVAEHCQRVNATKVLVYPYAHLSSSLEAPRAAVRVMDLTAAELAKVEGLTVTQAPFGVYKAFDVQVKGHPLSEHGRTIVADDKDAKGDIAASSAIRAEGEKQSEWLVLTPEGETIAAKDFDFARHPDFDKFWAYERGGSRISEEPPPHIKLMQEHELVDYEPGSDQGTFRWYPNGFLIKKLLEDQISNQLAQYGAMQVETPIMYDFNHAALAKYLDKFPARQYVVKSEKGEYFLRFAACFGQYLIAHDAKISYKNLPVRLYELTHYSFRREQSGELAGLRRLRIFTMPDMHTLCADVAQATGEMLNQVGLCYRWMADLGFDYVVALRAVKDFYHHDPAYAFEIAKRANRPVLLELWDRRYFYFVTKFEANVVDSQAKAAALSTVQIDVENPQGFGITYTAQDGSSQFPLMLHTSVSGSIDRNLYALLEQQAIRMQRGQKAHFPFWLAPTQIRLIPVKEHHLPHCEALAAKLMGRVDIDDRNETLGKRIRSAEKDWVPLTIAVGDREASGEQLPVRVRGEEQPRSMSVADLNSEVLRELEGKAYRGLNVPQRLSLRPIFRG